MRELKGRGEEEVRRAAVLHASTTHQSGTSSWLRATGSVMKCPSTPPSSQQAIAVATASERHTPVNSRTSKRSCLLQFRDTAQVHVNDALGRDHHDDRGVHARRERSARAATPALYMAAAPSPCSSAVTNSSPRRNPTSV
eukprot:COSAG01_NODE_1193_length_11306_cov_13.079408_3_plen_140_part_00